MKQYDYIIAGSGLFAGVFAYAARQHGKTCLVLEKRDHIGGNIYCEDVEGIHVHKYGAHIFHTSNKKVWQFVNSLAEFNRYTNSPVANFKGEMYNMPFNMNTFSRMWGVSTPAQAKAVIDEQRKAVSGEPKDVYKRQAYVIARHRFRFGLKRPLTYWILLVRVLPPVAFTIPLYTMFGKAGILGTKWPVILACVLINVPLIIWFLISFFRELPEEIEESAKVDGATEWQLFCRVVLPLVAPGIAAVAMLSFMYAWNEYTYTVIFTRSPGNYTVPLALSVLNTEDNLTNFGLVSAGGVISVVPIMLFVIFAQNYLISGLSSGAVKE